MVTGVIPSFPRSLPSTFIAHRAQRSHCSSNVNRLLLTHALALSASQFVRKKKCPRIDTSMLSGGFELANLTNSMLEDNLMRHQGGWHVYYHLGGTPVALFLPHNDDNTRPTCYKATVKYRYGAVLVWYGIVFTVNCSLFTVEWGLRFAVGRGHSSKSPPCPFETYYCR